MQTEIEIRANIGIVTEKKTISVTVTRTHIVTPAKVIAKPKNFVGTLWVDAHLFRELQ